MKHHNNVDKFEMHANACIKGSFVSRPLEKTKICRRCPFLSFFNFENTLENKISIYFQIFLGSTVF